MSGPSSSLQREEHGPVARLLLIAVGLLFILAGALLFGDALWMLLSEPRRFLALLLLALFGAIVVYGCILLRRGLAGWSEGALARDDAKVRRRFAEWMPFLGLVLGVMAWTSTAGRVPPLGFLWYLAVSLAFFPISAAIHELGHLIPGLLQGRELFAIRIWPWTFRRSGSAGFGVAPGLRVTDGIAGFVQWSGSADPGRMADLVMVWGGSIANIAWAALLVLLSGQIGATSPPALIPFLQYCALGSCLMGAWNLVPVWNDALAWSDGAQMLRLLGRGHRAFRIRGRLIAQGLQQRPRHWNVSSRELTDEETPHEADRAWLLLLALSVALDLDDRPECDRVLALHANEKGSPSDVLLEFALQRVLIHALLDHDAGAARTSLTRSPVAPPGYANLALAATLHAEGRRAQAGRVLEEWKRTAAKEPVWNIGNQWAIDRLEHDLTVAPPEQGEGS